MELLILLGFLLGWATCWMQESQYLGRLRVSLSELESDLAQESEKAKQQQLQILRLEEKVLAQERELESLRYRI